MYINLNKATPEWLVHEIGNAALATMFWTDYLAREKAELAAALKAQEEVSIANFKASVRPHESLGQLTFRIATPLRNWIAKRYGWEAATNEEFCKELIRDNRDICFVPTQEKRPMIVKSRDLGPPVITSFVAGGTDPGTPGSLRRATAETVITAKPGAAAPPTITPKKTPAV